MSVQPSNLSRGRTRVGKQAAASWFSFNVKSQKHAQLSQQLSFQSMQVDFQMNSEKFVSYVRRECVDSLVDRYVKMFTELALDQFTDAGMRFLAASWKAADPDERDAIQRFIRLGSQNTAATLLALLDNASGGLDTEVSLLAHNADGTSVDLGQDLLDTFWAQEERDRQVNRKP